MGILSLRIFPDPAPLFLPLRLLLALSYANKIKKNTKIFQKVLLLFKKKLKVQQEKKRALFKIDFL